MKRQNNKHFLQATKIIILAFCLFHFLLLTGCWDYEEYEDILLINGIGIDIGPDENEIALTIAYPSTSDSTGKNKQRGGTEGEEHDIVFTAYGKTIPEAVNEIQNMMSREIFLGYTSIIVLGEKITVKHMEKILNYIDTSPSIHMSARVIVAPGKASELLSIINKYEDKSVSNSLDELFDSTENTGTTFPITLKDFYKGLSTEGYEPVASAVRVRKSTGQKAEGQEKSLQGVVEPTEGEFEATGLALFDGFKIVGWLNEKESRGWGLSMNKKLRNFSTIYISKEEYLTYRILKNSSKVKVHIDNDLYIDIKIQVKCYIDEFSFSEDFDSPAVIQGIEIKIADAIEEEVRATVKKVQKEVKSDVFGMGFQAFRQHNKEWNQFYKNRWEEIFPDIPIYIDVDAEVLNTGFVNKLLQER